MSYIEDTRVGPLLPLPISAHYSSRLVRRTLHVHSNSYFTLRCFSFNTDNSTNTSLISIIKSVARSRLEVMPEIKYFRLLFTLVLRILNSLMILEIECPMRPTPTTISCSKSVNSRRTAINPSKAFSRESLE
ncbi:hypothetical protein TNCV_3457831 [Trichonephila clavipes]|nr:hypothetical protein TNCV_3457831 [Trichonephila clavipes]